MRRQRLLDPVGRFRSIAMNRQLLARFQPADGLQVPSVLVADREAVQEVFDGGEPDALQIGSALRSHAFQILKWRLQEIRHSAQGALLQASRSG